MSKTDPFAGLRRAVASAWGKMLRSPAPARGPSPIHYWIDAQGDMWESDGLIRRRLTTNRYALSGAVRSAPAGALEPEQQPITDAEIEEGMARSRAAFLRQSAKAEDRRSDVCIDCGGRGKYPSEAVCISCGGTGRVLKGDGIPQLEKIWEPPEPAVDWPTWSKMAGETEREGWSFCRFAIRARLNATRCVQMYGITRAGFGIYSDQFNVCDPINTNCRLWSLMHLRSGVGLGLFQTYELAAEAAELLDRLSIDINVLDLREGDAWPKIEALWTAAALERAPFHAHELLNGKPGPELYIWIRNWVTMFDRPEKLS